MLKQWRKRSEFQGAGPSYAPVSSERRPERRKPILEVVQVRTIRIIRIRNIRRPYVPEKSRSKSGPYPATCDPVVAAATPACACSRLSKARPLAHSRVSHVRFLSLHPMETL
eukprot:363729-Chlamydomonas_euryale.AAC.7